jgi:hypothetical protein
MYVWLTELVGGLDPARCRRRPIGLQGSRCLTDPRQGAVVQPMRALETCWTVVTSLMRAHELDDDMVCDHIANEFVSRRDISNF